MKSGNNDGQPSGTALLQKGCINLQPASVDSAVFSLIINLGETEVEER